MADWRIISETTPGSDYEDNGQLWIKPSTGECRFRVNGTWELMVDGDGITYEDTITIYIKGQNLTANTSGDFSKEDSLTSQVDTCSFSYENKDGVYKPTAGNEVIIFNRENPEDTPEKIFGGRIINSPQLELNKTLLNGKYIYDVECADYGIDLNKKLVTASYTDKTAFYIINDIIENNAASFSVHNVETGPTISYISWNNKPVSLALSEICDMTKGLYDWYADADKDIHFFKKASVAAPYSLNEVDEDGGKYKDLVFDVDRSELKNRVKVRAGYYLSNDFTQEIVADGEQLEFLLAYKPHAAASGGVEVYVDNVQKTVGTDFLTTSGKDFNVNFIGKFIKNLDIAKLTAGQVLKVIYKYEVPIYVQVDDETSQDHIRETEGGSGIYERFPIVDYTIVTLEGARDRAYAELAKYSQPIANGSFVTNAYGYRSGQTLTIVLPTRDINGSYMIANVSTQNNANILDYTIEFTSMRTKKFVDMIVNLLDNKDALILREDEILEEILNISEILTVTETARNFSEPTNEWDTARWNEFQWG